LAVLLTGAAYFAGLVVVNLHLRQYGVSILGFFAQEYVTAGIWVWLPAVPGIVTGTLFWGIVERNPFRHLTWPNQVGVAVLSGTLPVCGYCMSRCCH
jgi:hypothetical protein